MAWLLDTDVISETRRLKPEAKVLAFIADHALDDLYLSTLCRRSLSVPPGILLFSIL